MFEARDGWFARLSRIGRISGLDQKDLLGRVWQVLALMTGLRWVY